MFWNYCLSSGFFYIPLNPQDPSCQQNLQVFSFPTSASLPPPNQEKLLDLTAEDHLKAGYEKKKKLWEEDEDKKLRYLREKEHMEWEEIASHIPGRNAKMCYSRYKRLEYNPRENWKKSQNDRICELVDEHGQDWELISKFIKGRRPKQIKEHYMNYLKPEISKEDWSLAEDMQLVDLLNSYGTDWKLVEEKMSGRTQNQIKNRYFGRLKKLHEKKLNTIKVEEEENANHANLMNTVQ